MTKCCKSHCGTSAAHEAIAERAYYKWLNAGAPKDNDGLKFWFEAERELTHSEVELEEVEVE